MQANNVVSGVVPACLTNSVTLRELYLSGNVLNGTFPPIAAASALSALGLASQVSQVGTVES